MPPRFKNEDNDKLVVEVKCLMCKEEHNIKVNRKGYMKWLNGTNIQHALPELSVNDRELLISNICGTCFDKVFGKDE